MVSQSSARLRELSPEVEALLMSENTRLNNLRRLSTLEKAVLPKLGQEVYLTLEEIRLLRAELGLAHDSKPLGSIAV